MSEYVEMVTEPTDYVGFKPDPLGKRVGVCLSWNSPDAAGGWRDWLLNHDRSNFGYRWEANVMVLGFGVFVYYG